MKILHFHRNYAIFVLNEKVGSRHVNLKYWNIAKICLFLLVDHKILCKYFIYFRTFNEINKQFLWDLKVHTL